KYCMAPSVSARPPGRDERDSDSTSPDSATCCLQGVIRCLSSASERKVTTGGRSEVPGVSIVPVEAPALTSETDFQLCSAATQSENGAIRPAYTNAPATLSGTLSSLSSPNRSHQTSASVLGQAVSGST